MPYIMTYTKYFILAIVFILQACKPEEVPSKTAPQPEPIKIEFKTYWGNQIMHPDSTYFDREGRPFRLYDFKIIWTDLQLIDDQQNTLTLPRNRFMTRLGHRIQDLNVFKEQNFQSFTLRFGVDSLTNTTVEPTMISDVNDPFYPQMPSMWWTWAHGFIFARIEGFTDWSQNFGSEGHEVFGYHLGAFKLDRTIGPFQAKLSGGKSSLALKLDVKKVFDGLDFPADNSTHSFDNPKLTEKIVQLICDHIEEDL